VLPALRILGRMIDDRGVRMNPDEVNCVLDWRVLADRKPLRNLCGSAVYLVDDNPNIHFPMGLRSSWAEDTVPFQCSYTWQPAFEEVKDLDHRVKKYCRMPPDYSKVVVATAWMTTDDVAEVIVRRSNAWNRNAASTCRHWHNLEVQRRPQGANMKYSFGLPSQAKWLENLETSSSDFRFD